MVKKDIEKLGNEFAKLNWSFKEEEINGQKEIISYWPGDPNEDIMVCVLKSSFFKEVFHRQDFFFINFAYSNNFEVLSTTSDNKINIRENDCYIGQPFSGYALLGDTRSEKEDIVIIGLLIRKDVFLKEYLSSITSAQRLFQFILEPENNSFSENFIHVSFPKTHPIRKMIEISVSEYANKSKNTQAILKALTLSILMYINQQAEIQENQSIEFSLTDKIIQYIQRNLRTVTLKAIAEEFSYHPNYISNILRKKTGKSFSEIVLNERMRKAELLLQRTDLSIKEIANIIGFSSTGNFYKAFKKYFKVSPRQLISS